MTDCEQLPVRPVMIYDCFNNGLLKRNNYKTIIMSLMVVASIWCRADNNLTMNGALDSEQADFPPFWYTTTSGTTRYERSGGPGGMGAVHLQKTANIRQGGMELVSGEKYRLSGMFKTRNFKPRVFMFVVHNAGWAQQVGFVSIPQNTKKWIKLDKVFKLMKSVRPTYGVAVHIADAKGELWATDIKLEPVSPKAKALSKNPIADPTRLIIPWKPRLNYISLIIRSFLLKLEKIHRLEIFISAVIKLTSRRKNNATFLKMVFSS